jgi:hypothetical protein
MFKSLNAIKSYLSLHEALSDEQVAAASKVEKPVDDDAMLKSGEITADAIINKLNSIRSGRSFKDEDIKSSLQTYMDSLEKAEKVALFSFLKGIAQIVSGEVSGEKALEPSDPKPSVTMKKDLYKKKIKPTVVKRTEKVKGDTSENSPPPPPIKPKS